MSAVSIDYERLAALLNNLGITPARLEATIARIIASEESEGLARLTDVEQQILYLALGDGIVDMRREQDALLRTLSNTLIGWRSMQELRDRTTAQQLKIVGGAILIMLAAIIGLLVVHLPTGAAAACGQVIPAI